MRPGYGEVHGSLGFDRHREKMMIVYMDSHAEAFSEAKLEEFSFFGGKPDEASGDFMIQYTGDYGCRGSKVHTWPPIRAP